MSTILFAECTFGGPHSYVRTKNSGVRHLDLAYIRSQRIIVWLLFFKGLRSR
jgi:hypothetical protein